MSRKTTKTRRAELIEKAAKLLSLVPAPYCRAEVERAVALHTSNPRIHVAAAYFRNLSATGRTRLYNAVLREANERRDAKVGAMLFEQVAYNGATDAEALEGVGQHEAAEAYMSANK